MTVDWADWDHWFGQALARALAVPAPGALPPAPAAPAPDAVAARLRFHGLAGLLASDAAGMAQHPAWLADLIAGEAQMQRVWEHTHRQALLPLVAALAEAGIAPLLLKGTALAYAVYPYPAMRARGDSDLLVAPEQVPTARRILAATGFARTAEEAGAPHQEDWLIDSGFGHRHGIDLHWRTAQSAAMEAIVPAAALLASRQPLPRLSPQAWAPSLVQTFLQSHINQFAHSANGYVLDGVFVAGAGRLGWLVDDHLIASALAASDWADLVRISRATGVAPSVAASLRRARALLATPIPAGVLDQLDQQPGPSTVSAYFDYSSPLRRLALDWRAARGWRQALAQARAHILPPRARIMHMHPEYPAWPLVLLHARRMGHMVWRTLAGGGRPA